MKNSCMVMGFIFLHIVIHAQVKIGNNSTTINSASLLELETTNKGVVFPRLSLSSISLSSPLPSGLLTGTVVYNTNAGITNGNGVGLYVWNGSIWIPGFNTTAWNLTGNAGTATVTNFLGTTDGTGLLFKVNNIQAGYLGLSGSSYATALGVGSSGTFTAFQATAIGAGAQAISNTSLALGYAATASAQDAIAIGNSAQATTNNEVIAIGHSSSASSYQSIALGVSANASSGNQTIAIGTNSTASGYQGIAIGYASSATTNNSVLAVGVNSTASGYQSTAIGNSAAASAQNSTAIGNGATASQTNALILGNSSANVGIGTSTPNTSAKLDVAGSFKLGTAGSLLSGIIKTSITVTPSVIVGITSTVTATVTGANTGSNVIINPRSNLANGVVIAYYYISAANTITIGFNSGLTTGSLGSLTFDVTVIQ